MTSMLQGGFLLREARSGPNKCIICHKGGTSAETVCSSCQQQQLYTGATRQPIGPLGLGDVTGPRSHVCITCSPEASSNIFLQCGKKIFCKDCYHDCSDTDSQQWVASLKSCSNITPCSVCQTLFCKEDEKSDDDNLTVLRCQKNVCYNDCKECVRDCNKCGGMLRDKCLNREQQHRGNRREGREPQMAPVSEAEGEAEKKYIVQARVADAAPASAAAAIQQASSAAHGPNAQSKKSKKKKNKKVKALAAKAAISVSSPDVALAAATAAPPLAAQTPAKDIEQSSLASSSTAVNDRFSHHSDDLVNDHDKGHPPVHHSVDDIVMDHSEIKKWVMSVAARETDATLPEIRRYFNGRVEKVIIDACLVQLHNNLRDTVMACAEFMSIVVPPDVKANTGVKSSAKEKRKEEQQLVEAGAAALPSPEEEKEEDDGVAGGYLKPGDSDFDFIEHPLEKRATKARENDCKDVKELQDILDEAKGQPGLARTRKLVSKMLKRVKAELEERKQLRQMSKLQEKSLATKEISQKLHPAYANNGPGYASFKPPSIPDCKQPDATINVPQNVVGWVIGKAGIRIIQLQERTNAAMWIDQNFPNGHARKLHIYGKSFEVEAAVAQVEYLIKSAPINNARRVIPPSEVGAPSCLPPGHPDIPPNSSAPKTHVHKVVLCPHSLVGLLIGKKGATIMKIKSDSSANVEVNQNFPEGVPREVDITGSPGSVDLAVAMVEEIIASGNRADASTVVTPSAAAVDRSSTSTAAFAPPPAPSSTGPVLGFGSSAPMRSSLTPVEAMARDFGDLGGLGQGATSTVYPGMNGAAAAGLQDVNTRSAIEKLHPGIQGGASPAGETPALSPFLQADGTKVHGSYLDQQGYLFFHHNLHYQQQHQHQQHPLYPLQQQYQHQHPPWPQPLQQQQQPTASEANGARSDGGLGENVGSDGLGVAQDSLPFGSIQELLASVGFPLLLSNFLEQEFDLKSVALMQDKDFEEIKAANAVCWLCRRYQIYKVPKGPQLKIQRALRAAGIGSAESKSSRVSAAVATPDVAEEEEEEEKRPRSDDGCCAICLERKIEVIFLDCGHQICCKQCGDPQVGKNCPICRTPVVKAVRFYTG